jgi:hypothetical protein
VVLAAGEVGGKGVGGYSAAPEEGQAEAAREGLGQERGAGRWNEIERLEEENSPLMCC